MKKERHFFKRDNMEIIFSLIVVLCYIVCGLITFGIKYNYNISKYGYELSSYSDTTYEDLSRIPGDVIKEGVGLDLLSLPDNVSRYAFINIGDYNTFTCSLNNDMRFVDEPTITVKVSDDFKVISESRNISSQEEYVKSVRKNMALNAVIYAVIASLILVTIGIVVLFICEFIKINRKSNKD